MAWRFEGSVSSTREQIESLASATPHTPFNGPAYAAACAAVGKTPCTLLLRAEPNFVEGCLAFLERRAFWRRLSIVTAPRVTEPTTFWSGVWDFCRKHGVWELDVQSFGSDATDIPTRPGELSRRTRCEYVLDLDTPDPFGHMPPKRRHDIERARKAGLTVRRSHEASATRTHLNLMQASAQRRRDRGQAVSLRNDRLWFEALLASGAAELFQAVDDDRTYSSAIIVHSNSSAYYQSAGASPEGMRVGASAFLVSEAARALREEGVRLFNLGGADLVDEGLRFFKASFGAREVVLQAATFSIVSPILQKLTAAGRRMRRDFSRVLSS